MGRTTSHAARICAARDFLRREGIENEPCFTESPRPDFVGTDAHFSVSHSGNIWGAVFSLSPIALDFEKFPMIERNLDGIAARFFTAGERALYESALDKNAAFCDIWTKKEALVKLSGIGIAGLKNADSTGKNCFIALPRGAESFGIRGNILFGGKPGKISIVRL